MTNRDMYNVGVVYESTLLMHARRIFDSLSTVHPVHNSTSCSRAQRAIKMNLVEQRLKEEELERQLADCVALKASWRYSLLGALVSVPICVHYKVFKLSPQGPCAALEA